MNNYSEEHHRTEKKQTSDLDHFSAGQDETSTTGPTPYAVIWKDGEELLLY